jgi:hypothetical protein
MPSKVFDVLDVINPQSHSSSGNLDYIVIPGITHVLLPMSDIVSNEAPLSFDANFDVDSTGEDFPGQANSRHQWISGIHTSTVTMDYRKPITGLPDGCRIKSMVIRSPWNCNIDMNITKTAGTFTGSMTKRMRVRREIAIGAFLDQRAFGPVTTTGQILQLIDEEINADADVEVFNFADPDDYLTLEQFVAQYKTIILRLEQESIQDLDTFQTLTLASPSGSIITNNVIYVVSFHTGWTITVEYEEQPISWTLDDPPSDRAVGPGDTMAFSSNPSDPDPLDPEQIETLEIALIDADGNEVGVRVPITNWLAEPNVLEFVLPDFQQSVNIQKIIIYMTSTQFTGSLALQQVFAIYFYNAPGVYTLTTGRAHDTYYNRDEEEIATVDTKIPNPTGKTGYY